jgi:AraC family ethanolamine operon transcriptional activator
MPDAAAAPTALALPGSWRWHQHSDDVDAHARAQPGWQIDCLQLSAGRFQGEVQHVQLPGLRLVREHSSRALRQRGALGHGAFGFAMALEAPGELIFNGQRVAGDGIMAGRSDELDLRTPEGMQLIAVVVDAALLQPLWEQLYLKPPSAWLDAQLALPVRPAAAAAVRRLHVQLMQRLMPQPAEGAPPDAATLLRWRDALLVEWIEALPEAVHTTALPTLAARQRIVDRACAVALADPARPPSMLELCRAVGASRRKLNYCFQDVLGCSPLKVLRAARLQAVRRELRSGGGTVQDAAARWGFHHAGQFAADYRRHFGELPSQALRPNRKGTAPCSTC